MSASTLVANANMATKTKVNFIVEDDRLWVVNFAWGGESYDVGSVCDT